MNRDLVVLRRIRVLTSLFIIGLVVSGATAIPLQCEVDWLVSATGAQRMIETGDPSGAPAWALWLTKVQMALRETNAQYPFLFYGTDWLAFGHFAIAIAFLGAGVREGAPDNRCPYLHNFRVVSGIHSGAAVRPVPISLDASLPFLQIV